MNRLLLLLMLLCPLGQLHAQRKAAEDKQLKAIFGSLQARDGLRFRVSVATQLHGDTSGKTMMVSDNYRSRTQFLVWTSSENGVFFVCSQGQVRVDHEHKEIQVQAYDAGMLAEAKQLYEAEEGQQLDSFFLNGAVIDKKTSAKGQLSYKLSYPGHKMLHGLNLVFNTRDSLVSSFRYNMDRPLLADNSSVVQQVVTMDRYRREQPENLPLLIRAIDHPDELLTQAYKGYTLKKI